MDEYEVMYVDDDERNAVRDYRRPAYGRRRPGSIFVPPTNRPTVIRHFNRPERYPSQVVVQQQQPSMGGALAGLSTGELIELAAQAFAALQPLPGAPTGQGHVPTDVENLVLYQTALANHAKRDEQVRTIGGLLSRLLK